MDPSTYNTPGAPRKVNGGTRREILVTAGFTGLAAIATAGFARPDKVSHCGTPSPDAELLALVDQVIENQAKADALMDPYLDTIGGPPRHVMAAVYALNPSYHDLIAKIGSIPAHTTAGLRAKARVAMTNFDIDADDTVSPGSDEFVAWSICRDLLRGRP